MDKAWEKAVEAARAEQDPSETVSLTLDGALKCSQCRLPPPALFEQFSRLQHLSIANAGLTSLEGFPCLPHLKRLVLSDNRIAGGLEYLVQAGLKSLQDLDLSNNRIQGFDDLAPLSQLNLVSLDLYECPVTRLPGYSARVFGIVKSLQYLDKTDVDGKERFESDDDGEELDSEDEEDVDDFIGEDKSNGFRTGNPAVDQDEEDFDDEDEEDELDVEEDEYQDGVTINGHGAAPGHMAAAVGAGNSSEDDEVEDEDDCENAEVQDLEEEDEGESDEVAEAEDDDDAGVAEDEEDEDGTEQVSGAPGELDIQKDNDNVEDEDGELGDEEEDDEGVENDVDDDGEDEEEDYGTEYLVQPIGKAEDDEGGSDFEPVEDGGEDDDDLDEDEDDDNYIVGNQKRNRDEVDNDSDDEDRNPKRR